MAKKRDPAGVKRDILAQARTEFVEHGFAGARIERIAQKTETSKRMLYYYFSDKESLYNAVLLQAYSDIRQLEMDTELSALKPQAALSALFCAIFDHYRRFPDYIRLIMIENISSAQHLRALESAKSSGDVALNRIAEILKRGQCSGVFQPNLNPLIVHWKISALCCFNVTNRHTFSALFGDSLWQEDNQTDLRDDLAAMLIKGLSVPVNAE